MNQSQIIPHTMTLTLRPNKHWLALGPGWAAIAGVLASGAIRFETQFWAQNGSILLQAGLLWLLADLILGSLWQLSVGHGVWRTVMQSQQSANKPTRVLPYTQTASMGYRAAKIVSRLKAQPDGLWQTFAILSVSAVAIALLLGPMVVLYSVLSIVLAVWLGQLNNPAGTKTQLWQSMGVFLLPYLAGLSLGGEFRVAPVLLGLGYWVIYWGLIRLRSGFGAADRLVIVGQGAISALLFAYLQPIAATVVMLAALFSMLLRFQFKQQAAFDLLRFVSALSPFVLIGFLIAANALGSLS